MVPSPCCCAAALAGSVAHGPSLSPGAGFLPTGRRGSRIQHKHPASELSTTVASAPATARAGGERSPDHMKASRPSGNAVKGPLQRFLRQAPTDDQSGISPSDLVRGKTAGFGLIAPPGNSGRKRLIGGHWALGGSKTVVDAHTLTVGNRWRRTDRVSRRESFVCRLLNHKGVRFHPKSGEEAYRCSRCGNQFFGSLAGPGYGPIIGPGADGGCAGGGDGGGG